MDIGELFEYTALGKLRDPKASSSNLRQHTTTTLIRKVFCGKGEEHLNSEIVLHYHEEDSREYIWGHRLLISRGPKLKISK